MSNLMKSKNKIKVLLRYEYLDVHSIERMLYIVFIRNRYLYYINDKASIITQIDDHDHEFEAISNDKMKYIKYNSKVLTLKKLNEMVSFLKIMQGDIQEASVKSIKRSLKIQNLLK